MTDSEQEYYSAEELEKKWENNQVALPKIPFFLINLYQFIMPLFVVLFFIALVLWIYDFLAVPLWIQIILSPFIFMGGYFLLIWSMSKFCRLLNAYYDKKSPPREGLYSREFDHKNVVDPAVHYYHLRGFMYKWPVWVSKKSMFPWLVNFVLRDMAGNKIHKNFYYGDSYVCLEFSDLGDGAAVENGAVISSHVVDSIFGNLTVKEVKLEKNAVLNTTAVMAPGTTIEKDAAVGPRSFLPKNWKITKEKSEFIYGVPAKYYDYRNFLDLLPEKFQKQWENKKKEMEIKKK